MAQSTPWYARALRLLALGYQLQNCIRIGEFCPDAQLEALYKLADEEQQACYPRLIHVRLNTIWMGLYIVLITLGIMLALWGFLA
ncbi:MAG TPA: hypothetical protein VFN35_03440 [Ktedonobacteraceae bacterium]|nr:hypothetical protein [Ktedonobacteraceae bacterium]